MMRHITQGLCSTPCRSIAIGSRIFTWDVRANQLGHFKCNDAEPDTVVLDASGAPVNNGIFVGGNTVDKSVPGKINNGLNLDGNDYINWDTIIGDTASDTVGTWVLWVKPVDATPIAAEMFISFGDVNGNEIYQLGIKPDGKAQAFFRVGGVNKFQLETNAAAFLDATWTQIAIVQDGIEVALYVNGVKVAQTFTISTDKTVWNANASGLDNVRVGCRNFNSGGNTLFFNGDVDDVRIFNRALTVIELLGLNKEGNGTEESRG